MKEQHHKLVSAYEEFIHTAKRYPTKVRMSHRQYAVFTKVLEYLELKNFHGCKEIVTDSVIDGEYIFN
jgi:hypothetical protein